MENAKLCPMMSVSCVGKKCGWWLADLGNCSVPIIASGIDTVGINAAPANNVIASRPDGVFQKIKLSARTAGKIMDIGIVKDEWEALEIEQRRYN